jgi:hypothetical protein
MKPGKDNLPFSDLVAPKQPPRPAGITLAALQARRSNSHRKGTTSMSHTRTLWLAGLAAALLTLPAARAAGPDKLLPADTKFVLTVNVKQILDSPLVKKRGLATAKDALKSADQVNQILEELGFDPFTDLDRITIAGPGGSEKDRGLVIVRGRFDLDKFKARADKAMQDDPDVIKSRKVAGGIVYEVSPPGQESPFFVALLNKTTIVVSPGKDYVVEAMKKDAGKSDAPFKDEDFRALLARMDDKQSLAFAGVGSAFKGGDLGPAGEILEKIDAIGGGLTIADELKLEVVVSARTEDDAKKLKDTVNTGINSGIALLGVVASDNKDLDKVMDILKTIKATSKDKTVTLKARIGADVLEELSDKEEKKEENKDKKKESKKDED